MYGKARVCGGVLGSGTHERLRLERHHLLHARRVAAEVHSVSSSHLEHTAGEPREQAVSVHANLSIAAAAKPVKEAGEDWMASLLASGLGQAIHGAIVARSDP
jgi:hypothetical protein